jgi:hypothetical protein
MRKSDDVAPGFRQSSLGRDMPAAPFERAWAMGIAVTSNHILTFGGALYSNVESEGNLQNYKQNKVPKNDITQILMSSAGDARIERAHDATNGAL